MKKSILVIDADEVQCREFCELLEKGQFKATPSFSSYSIEKNIKNTGCKAIFWDIDTVTVDNQKLRDLTIKFPSVYFFCLSCHPFHPELQDAICYHIYACINRPDDSDELFFWLRCIEENEVEQKSTNG